MSLLKPWLFLPAELAHNLSPLGLRLYSSLLNVNETPVWQPFNFKNLHFKNRLGLAGGVDKNATELHLWQNVGCGFLEVGTVTPLKQNPNPGKIIDRHNSSKVVWNKMGFPSDGAMTVHKNISRIKTSLHVPLFVNIGKNRQTSNELAKDDYISLMTTFKDAADGFVINISSPNTQGLRDLAQPDQLKKFLSPIINYYNDHSIKTPLFLKLSPDLLDQELENIILQCLDFGFDGFILTNTTLDRNHPDSSNFPKEGGLSGSLLKTRSVQSLKVAKRIIERQNDKKCLISVGGVMTASDVFERINLGADLVQVYSALIFEGPGFFRKVAQFAKTSREFGYE